MFHRDEQRTLELMRDVAILFGAKPFTASKDFNEVIKLQKRLYEVMKLRFRNLQKQYKTCILGARKTQQPNILLREKDSKRSNFCKSSS